MRFWSPALWRCYRDGRTVQRGLIYHSGAGSQHTSYRFTTHLVDAGIDASTGLCKTELIKCRGPWRSLADVELAAGRRRVGRPVQRTPHSAIGYVPPADTNRCTTLNTGPRGGWSQRLRSPQKSGRFNSASCRKWTMEAVRFV
jgi:hypothetical protein